MIYELEGCFRRPTYETELQDQIDLARWEDEGGAPAPCVRPPAAGTSRRLYTAALRQARADLCTRELLTTA